MTFSSSCHFDRRLMTRLVMKRLRSFVVASLAALAKGKTATDFRLSLMYIRSPTATMTSAAMV